MDRNQMAVHQAVQQASQLAQQHQAYQQQQQQQPHQLQHQQQHQLQHQQQHHQQPQQPQQQVMGYGTEQLLHYVREVLETFLDIEYEESTMAVTHFIAQFTYPDSRRIWDWMGFSGFNPLFLKGKVIEGLAAWVRAKTQEIDQYVHKAHRAQAMQRDQAAPLLDPNLRKQIEQACFQSPPSEVLAEFIASIAVTALGNEAASLASALAGGLVQDHASAAGGLVTMAALADNPPKLFALMVQKLCQIQAKLAKVALVIYRETKGYGQEDFVYCLLPYFHLSTIDTTSTVWTIVQQQQQQLRQSALETSNVIAGAIEHCTAPFDAAFANSQFKISLVDTCGALLALLYHLESVCTGPNPHSLAVDFEGEQLHRHGELCLVQITCSDNPTLVHVLDVFVLGRRAFELSTPAGTSIKRLLCDPKVRKVWFDPRNDVDALWHQFEVFPEGVFDLQMADVSCRRHQGQKVVWVHGLGKCLEQCPALGHGEKAFAHLINDVGKKLFEPKFGGTYAVFKTRPLNPTILVYAAHDSRFMFLLYEQFMHALDEDSIQKVLRQGDLRARQCFSEYRKPEVEAPDF